MDIKTNIQPPWEPLLTSEEAGAYLRVHPKTVIRLARQRHIPAIRLPGGKLWRFRHSDLTSWAASRVSSSCHPDE
ncbi:MAG: helix-turn-helix domain-containing protein [Acidobacteriota bacterium]